MLGLQHSNTIICKCLLRVYRSVLWLYYFYFSFFFSSKNWTFVWCGCLFFFSPVSIQSINSIQILPTESWKSPQSVNPSNIITGHWYMKQITNTRTVLLEMLEKWLREECHLSPAPLQFWLTLQEMPKKDHPMKFQLKIGFLYLKWQFVCQIRAQPDTICIITIQAYQTWLLSIFFKHFFTQGGKSTSNSKS